MFACDVHQCITWGTGERFWKQEDVFSRKCVEPSVS